MIYLSGSCFERVGLGHSGDAQEGMAPPAAPQETQYFVVSSQTGTVAVEIKRTGQLCGIFL